MVPQDVDNLEPPPSRASAPFLIPDTRSLSASMPSLPYQPTAPSPLFASASTSRALSPQGYTPVNGGATGRPARPAVPLPYAAQAPRPDDIKTLILQSFVPHVAVHASADTDELAQEKGFRNGLWEMLRPFGERIHGKVTIRDSIGASRSWDDFSIRFVKLGDGLGDPRSARRADAEQRRSTADVLLSGDRPRPLSSAAALRTGGNIGQIEELVDKQLSYAESMAESDDAAPAGPNGAMVAPGPFISPFYTSFLRGLLSGLPLSPHETFSHPVACVIAISSRNASPIEALRQLYDSTSSGEKRLPQWVHGDYLRYYVLVHDEDVDDIAKSTKLFEQMKRHFGLHCHLLRLRSSRCIPSDDDNVRVPDCQWISAAESLSEIEQRESDDDTSYAAQYLYESDMTAIKTFIREIVTQSVLPVMERCINTWNDQIASRRRGISGRFMSLSRKWTGFGSSMRGTGFGTSPGASNANYDPLQGFYRPDTAEAIMRKLADYAFMLRDWKLAHSTYDIIRADFNDDKAWKYYAGANEMTAISALLLQQTMSGKARSSDTVDLMLDTASYSYLTRCAAPYSALRCLALGAELLRARGGPAADDAARWAMRILESDLLEPVGQALFTQHVAACYATRRGAGSKGWGSRRRKAAMWNVLAASAWLRLKKMVQARKCLDLASGIYHRGASHDRQHGDDEDNDGEGEVDGGAQPALRRPFQAVATFEDIQAFVLDMARHVDAHTAATQAIGTGDRASTSSNNLVPDDSHHGTQNPIVKVTDDYAP